MAKYNVEVVSNHVCDLGEGPYWDVKSQTLYYVDLFKGEILHFDPKTGGQDIVELEESPVSIVIPIKDSNNEFIITQLNKLYKLDGNTKQTQLLAEVEKSDVEIRFNDGKCDSSGRLWFGTLSRSDFKPGYSVAERKPSGALYSYDSTSKLVKRFPDVYLSNGIAWSSDNKHLYFVDSVKRVIHSFDFDIKTGNIENNRILFDFKKSEDFSSTEVPDGMTIDRSGNLWVACFGGAKIVQISTKTGLLIDSVKLPAIRITSVCFGGQQLNELYVTSGVTGEESGLQEPNAGKLFRITSESENFRGFEANAFSALIDSKVVY